MKIFTGYVWCRINKNGEFSEYINEHSNSINGGKFPDEIRTVSFSERLCSIVCYVT